MRRSQNPSNTTLRSCLTIDVEDWFHILDSPDVPTISRWSSLESRIERNLQALLEILDFFSVKVTFFWLGWLAERNKPLVKSCYNAGHEIASHGHAHLLPYRVGPDVFREDIARAKALLEDMIGQQVRGFRAAGFGITKKAPWAFEVIKNVGYQYDSSVFPASRGHGGMPDSPVGLHFVETRSGHLLEIPMSVIEVFGRRTSFFGGGYLRLANRRLIKWGIDKLQGAEQPLIIYIHPREIDPDQPRLPLTLLRHFKCYVNLHSTLPKLKWLCKNYRFCTMLEMVEDYIRLFYRKRRMIPVTRAETEDQSNPAHIEAFRKRLLLVERAMADFLYPVRPLASQERQELQPSRNVFIPEDYVPL